MKHFTVTYGIVTEESAERSDYAEQGFILAGGEHVELPEGAHGDSASSIKAQCQLTLREAVAQVNTACLYDNGDSFAEQDERRDITTGDVEFRTLNIPNSVTGASYRRLSKLICNMR